MKNWFKWRDAPRMGAPIDGGGTGNADGTYKVTLNGYSATVGADTCTACPAGQVVLNNDSVPTWFWSGVGVGPPGNCGPAYPTWTLAQRIGFRPPPSKSDDAALVKFNALPYGFFRALGYLPLPYGEPNTTWAEASFAAEALVAAASSRRLRRAAMSANSTATKKALAAINAMVTSRTTHGLLIVHPPRRWRRREWLRCPNGPGPRR